ncbi:uncharacterized protein FIBRA_07566 [Fibroporia radiculosa]|uniref:Uncharacterized protein n=1 Tax=Fibroporia radiculosa TaxID=599839 RepID=J4I0X0_9APHY|nr:uncharacterized protein FIBRA_07566 [Fibroporia radiculosa]CCM05352.1 predicted protein [Fibroporia radiculosa]
MLAAICITFYRRRNAMVAPIFQCSSPDLSEKDPKRSLLHSGPLDLPCDLEADLFSPHFALNRGSAESLRKGADLGFKLSTVANRNALTHSISTLGAPLSPSRPRFFKVESQSGREIGVEMRVTPPTPHESCTGSPNSGLPTHKSEFSIRRMKFGSFGSGLPVTQSIAESKWWFL